jgi:hypothetical protein
MVYYVKSYKGNFRHYGLLRRHHFSPRKTGKIAVKGLLEMRRQASFCTGGFLLLTNPYAMFVEGDANFRQYQSVWSENEAHIPKQMADL